MKVPTKLYTRGSNGFFTLITIAFLSSLFAYSQAAAETPSTVKAFVYTEVQNSVPFDQVPWKKINPVISAQPGFINKTWFSGLGNHSVGGIYAFDSIENAQKYVTEFFPDQARKQSTGHTTRVFDAAIVEEASRDIGSAYFGGEISVKPGAFVYTELQVNIPFENVPWQNWNPGLKTEPGLLSKTWLSGVNTNTIGGVYAFDTIENAKHFALESFPKAAEKMNTALYIRIFDASVVEDASREMHSPFFQNQTDVLKNMDQADCGLVKLGGTQLESTVIQKPALFPEGIDYNPNTDKFVVGSFRDGGVYEISLDGASRQLIRDERLSSVLAVRVDAKRNRLWVANSDIGASIHPYSGGPKKLASLGVYELSSGKAIHFIDLGKLLPNKNHLANGMTLDADGNAYVTDSFSPVIYKVDTQGNASIFLESDRFSGEGINLNGIVFHSDGYLIVVKKGEGVLFKVPLSNPDKFTEIKSPRKFVGGDGLILVNNKELIVIANRASGEITETAFALNSEDGWETTKVTGEYKFGKVYPTTGVVRKDKVYVMHSNLKDLMTASKEEKGQLRNKATIQQIGSIKR